MRTFRFAPLIEALMEVQRDDVGMDPVQICPQYADRVSECMLRILSDREMSVLVQYYGISGKAATLRVLSSQLGIIRTRVSQLRAQAVEKLQRQVAIREMAALLCKEGYHTTYTTYWKETMEAYGGPPRAHELVLLHGLASVYNEDGKLRDNCALLCNPALDCYIPFVLTVSGRVERALQIAELPRLRMLLERNWRELLKSPGINGEIIKQVDAALGEYGLLLGMLREPGLQA